MKPVMRATSLFVNDDHMKKLTEIARSRGLKWSQLVRVLIAEFLCRENRREAKLGGASGATK